MKVRRDATERSIVTGLRKVGAEVVHVFIAQPPGSPDLFVAFRGQWVAMEVKSPGGRLSPAQERMAQKAPVHVVSTVDEALLAIGAVGEAA